MKVVALLLDASVDPQVLAHACFQLTPDLCLKRPHSIFMDIEKCSGLYSQEQFLERLKFLCKDFEVAPKIGIADSLLKALMVAKYGSLDFHALPVSALLDYVNPLEPDEDLFKKTHAMVQVLEKLGIDHLDAFLALPAQELPSRFGPLGTLARARILGKMDPGWPHWFPPDEIEESCEGSFHQEALLQVIESLLAKIFLRLHHRVLCQLMLSFYLERHSFLKEHVRQWHFSFLLPQSKSKNTLIILKERLERDCQKNPLRARVVRIHLKVLQSAPDEQGQKSLGFSSSRLEALSTLLSQVAQDSHEVFRAQLHEQALAEKSWSKTLAFQHQMPDLSDYIPLRPTRLLKKPEKIEISHEKMFIRNKTYSILKWSMVEKIVQWVGYENQEVIRSYYCCDLKSKPSVWIFQNPEGEFYLHGYFI